MTDRHEKQKLGRGRWGLAPVKFCQNPFSGCGEKVEKCFGQSEARAAILHDGSAQKHKIVRGRWGLAFCQVSSKSIQWLRRRSRKNFQPIRGQGGHLGWQIGTKNTNLVEDIEDLLHVKFHQNPFSGCAEEVQKCFSQSEARTAILDDRMKRKTQIRSRTLRTCFLSSFVKICSAVAEKKSKNISTNQRPERPSWMTDRHEKQKLGRGRWGLASCQVLSKSVQPLQRRSPKIIQPIRGQGGHLGWPIGTKNTN